MKAFPRFGKQFFIDRKDAWVILAESVFLFAFTFFDLGKVVITTAYGRSGTNIRFNIYNLPDRLNEIVRSLGYLSIEIGGLPLIESLILAAQILMVASFFVLLLSVWMKQKKNRARLARIGFFLYSFVIVSCMVAAPIVDNEIAIASAGLVTSIIQLSAYPYVLFFAGVLSLLSVNRFTRSGSARKMTTRMLAISGVLAAFVLLMTSIIKIPVPATGGYVHPGDGVILFAALLLGPYAALIGGIGSALADLLGGYFVYILPTFLIKALMGALAGMLVRDGKTMRNAAVFSLSAALMVFLYYVAEGLMYSFGAALASVIPNMLQGIAAVIIGTALSFSVRPLRKFL